MRMPPPWWLSPGRTDNRSQRPSAGVAIAGFQPAVSPTSSRVFVECVRRHGCAWGSGPGGKMPPDTEAGAAAFVAAGFQPAVSPDFQPADHPDQASAGGLEIRDTA